jgi:hypothetical protein
MDAVMRGLLHDLGRAMAERDEDAVMKLAGVDRITARFMIDVGHGDVVGDAINPSAPDPLRGLEVEVADARPRSRPPQRRKAAAG